MRSTSHLLKTATFVLGVSAVAQQALAQAQHYIQTILVADQASVAAMTDAHLVNPWGVSRSSASPWWISDNGTGLSTLYDGKGDSLPLVVTIPPADSNSQTGTPTGTIFNGTSSFTLAPGKPAIFLFVTEDGTISGWNPGVAATAAVIVVNTKEKSVFKGLTSATVESEHGPQTLLYAADFRKARVQVYDSEFHHLEELSERFRDEELPEGYAPFNIQNVGGNLVVTFALQDSAKHDEVDGAGLGYAAIFSPEGRLIRRLQHGPWFNAPWGITGVPSDFGIYSHDLLIGQFGSCEILAFNPVNGRFEGRLQDASNHPITIDGLWGLSFANGQVAGSATALYFAAGSNHEQDGLFGSIMAVENTSGNAD